MISIIFALLSVVFAKTPAPETNQDMVHQGDARTFQMKTSDSYLIPKGAERLTADKRVILVMSDNHYKRPASNN